MHDVYIKYEKIALFNIDYSRNPYTVHLFLSSYKNLLEIPSIKSTG